MTKDERQEISSRRWLEKLRATIEAYTGFGKTKIATIIINLLRRKDKSRKVIVVVPTEYLQGQWIKILTEINQLDNTEVLVINSAVRREQLKCSLLILDEIHRYAANTFSKIFDVCQYSFVLGLTATLERLDKKHDILKRYAPICDKITMLEGRRNNWLPPFREYNLGIEMNPDEREQYNEVKNKFQSCIDKFESDFKLMVACSNNLKVSSFITPEGFHTYREPPVVTRAKALGWRGNDAKTAYGIQIANLTRERSQRWSVWGGNSTHPYSPERLAIHAINGVRYMQKMKKFIYDSQAKINAAAEIILAFKVRTITFAETIESAEKLAAKLGDKAITYHSKMKAIMVDGKKVAGKKLAAHVINKVEQGEALYLCTGKKLNEGADFPYMQLGVTTSRTSAPITYIQRRGRILRKYTMDDGSDKWAVVVNIYIKDTKDYAWLIKSQKKDQTVMWVDSVEELLEAEGLIEYSI